MGTDTQYLQSGGKNTKITGPSFLDDMPGREDEMMIGPAPSKTTASLFAVPPSLGHRIIAHRTYAVDNGDRVPAKTIKDSVGRLLLNCLHNLLSSPRRYSLHIVRRELREGIRRSLLKPRESAAED